MAPAPRKFSTTIYGGKHRFKDEGSSFLTHHTWFWPLPINLRVGQGPPGTPKRGKKATAPPLYAPDPDKLFLITLFLIFTHLYSSVPFLSLFQFSCFSHYLLLQSSSTIFFFSNSLLLQFSSSPILLFSYSLLLQFSSSPILSFSNSLILQFSSSPILLFSNSLILQFSYSPVLFFSNPLLLQFSYSPILFFSNILIL